MKFLRDIVINIVIEIAIGAAIILAIGAVISRNEARAAHLFAVLLEPSMNPATMDECGRRKGERPLYTVSFQNGSMTPWHHRTCWYSA